MKGICPNCEKASDLILVEGKELIEVRGEKIEVDVQYFKCTACGETFDDPKSDDDPLDKAYREFRKRKGLLQPEDIREIRKAYSLTQSELSRLLGWGAATLSRYENGALQSEAHNTTLKLIREPLNIYRLIESNGQFLTPVKKERLTKELETSIDEYCSLPDTLEERFGNYKPSILSGYQKLKIVKLYQMIRFFCKDGVVKTKLCKLLFYADFLHFKGNSSSISGCRYAHAYHGPVPDNYEHYFAMLIHDEESIRVEELYFGEYVGENFLANDPPDLSAFSDDEIKTILFVKEYFKGFNAKEIRDFSHAELGYMETGNGEIISYKYSDQLKIDLHGTDKVTS